MYEMIECKGALRFDNGNIYSYILYENNYNISI